jgi:predicted metal-dependent hydrolase
MANVILNTLKAAIEQWYRTKALSRLIDKTKRYSAILKVEPTSINLKDYKAMWGSCSPKGVVSYNWRIILAPHKIVDYIVVHELCHLIEPNHSSKYWKQVRSVIPDYKNSKEWLKIMEVHCLSNSMLWLDITNI